VPVKGLLKTYLMFFNHKIGIEIMQRNLNFKEILDTSWVDCRFSKVRNRSIPYRHIKPSCLIPYASLFYIIRQVYLLRLVHDRCGTRDETGTGNSSSLNDFSISTCS
jgi:hypothetical protein